MFVRLPTTIHVMAGLEYLFNSLGLNRTDGNAYMGIGDDRGSYIFGTLGLAGSIMLRDTGDSFLSALPQLVIRGSKEDCAAAGTGTAPDGGVFNGRPTFGSSMLYSETCGSYVYFVTGGGSEPVEQEVLSAVNRVVYAGDKFYTGIPDPNTAIPEESLGSSPVKLTPAGALRNQTDPPEKWARWVWPRYRCTTSGVYTSLSGSSDKYVVGNPQWIVDGQTFTRVPQMKVRSGVIEQGDEYRWIVSSGKYSLSKEGSGYILTDGESPGHWFCSLMTPEQSLTFGYVSDSTGSEILPSVTLAWNRYTVVVSSNAWVYMGEVALWR